MNYKKLKPKIGDVLKINESMSLVFEKLADDIAPIWHEVPPINGERNIEESTYVDVTSDIWFLYEKGSWRVMNSSERVEARRQESGRT